MATDIIWHGHSNFQIFSGGKCVLIDPFFTGNPSCKISWDRAEAADIVLISHDHHDHVGDAIAFCKKHKALCCAVFDTANALQKRGLPPELIGAAPNLGGTAEVLNVRISLVPALHTSESGTPVGFVVHMPDGFIFYHSGDTALFGDMALIGEEYRPHLALLPIGDYYTMNPAQAAKAARLISPKAVLPMHWGTFPALVQSTDTFISIMEKTNPDIRVINLLPGQSVSL